MKTAKPKAKSRRKKAVQKRVNRIESDLRLSSPPPSTSRANALALPQIDPEPDATDGDLVLDTLGGNESAYAMLVSRYRNVVVGYIYNRIRDYHLAEDLGQDAFC